MLAGVSSNVWDAWFMLLDCAANRRNRWRCGAGYGSQTAGNINAQLLPFLTRELNNPEGYTQQQTGAMLGQAEAGAGGSTAA